ncbi:conserved hypothetical protein [Ricinus communis]|uniref:Uncharacterized protein n=1 Tax=Ricinus communis TaxID=3988 RepID=B9T2N0_RICCO|nr:conserved hypothetical protein [Ricinus communis]
MLRAGHSHNHTVTFIYIYVTIISLLNLRIISGGGGEGVQVCVAQGLVGGHGDPGEEGGHEEEEARGVADHEAVLDGAVVGCGGGDQGGGALVVEDCASWSNPDDDITARV